MRFALRDDKVETNSNRQNHFNWIIALVICLLFCDDESSYEIQVTKSLRVDQKISQYLLVPWEEDNEPAAEQDSNTPAGLERNGTNEIATRECENLTAAARLLRESPWALSSNNLYIHIHQYKLNSVKIFVCLMQSLSYTLFTDCWPIHTNTLLLHTRPEPDIMRVRSSLATLRLPITLCMKTFSLPSLDTLHELMTAYLASIVWKHDKSMCSARKQPFVWRHDKSKCSAEFNHSFTAVNHDWAEWRDTMQNVLKAMIKCGLKTIIQCGQRMEATWYW